MLVDYFGRKTILILSTIVLGTGWIIIARSENLFFLLIGRAITGLSMGLITSPIQVFIIFNQHY